MKEFVDCIRRILDEIEISHRVINENGYPEIVFTLSKDEDCSENIILVIGISEELMLLKGFMEDYTLEKDKIPDAILFCNKWNGTKFLPQVFVSDSGEVVSSWCYTLSEELSDDYIKNHMILPFSSTSWNFFCDFLKEIG